MYGIRNFPRDPVSNSLMPPSRQRAFAVLWALLTLLCAHPAAAIVRYDHDLRADAQLASAVIRAKVTARTPLDVYRERLQLAVVKVFAGTVHVGSTLEVTSYKVTKQQRLQSAVADDAEVIGFVVPEGDAAKTLRFGPFRVVSSLPAINEAVERDVLTAVARAAQLKALLASEASDAALLDLIVETNDLDLAWNRVPRAEYEFNTVAYEDILAEDILDRLLERGHFTSAMKVLLRSHAINIKSTKLQSQGKALLQFGADASKPTELRIGALKAAESVLSPEAKLIPLLERALQDKNEEIRIHALRGLDTITSWPSTAPEELAKARSVATSLWQSEKSEQVRLELLRTSSLRNLAALTDDERVYSFVELHPRGYVVVRWGSFARDRAVRVREASIRDRASNHVVQVLRKAGSGSDLESQDPFITRIHVDKALQGHTVDLVVEGVIESADHTATPFRAELGTRTVETLWTESEASMWSPIDGEVDGAPDATAPNGACDGPTPDASTADDARRPPNAPTPTGPSTSHLAGVTMGMLFVLLLGWAARRMGSR